MTWQPWGSNPGAINDHFLTHAEHGLRQGYVDIASNGSEARAVDSEARGGAVGGEGRHGVAVWHSGGAEIPGPDSVGGGGRLVLGCGRHIDRVRALDEAVERHRPTEPHAHLAFLAVAPARWGEGIATQLLRAHHRRLDHADSDAYLIAGSDQARRLCRRHGYQDHGPTIQLPDGPMMWPMWRAAQPSGGGA